VILNVLIWAALLIGLFFNALGVIGILRFPDVYTRLHADTKATTFGSIFTSLAVMLYGVSQFFSTTDGQYAALVFHTIIAVIVLAVTNATGAHAIARAAHKRGHGPNPSVVDRLKETSK